MYNMGEAKYFPHYTSKDSDWIKWDHFISNFKNLREMGFHFSDWEISYNEITFQVKRSPKFKGRKIFSVEEQRRNEVDLRNFGSTKMVISEKDLCEKLLISNKLMEALHFPPIIGKMEIFPQSVPDFPQNIPRLSTELLRRVSGASRYQLGSHLTDIYDHICEKMVDFYRLLFTFTFFPQEKESDVDFSGVRGRNFDQFLKYHIGANPPDMEKDEFREFIYLPHLDDDDSIIDTKIRLLKHVASSNYDIDPSRAGHRVMQIKLITNDRGLVERSQRLVAGTNIVINHRRLNEIYTCSAAGRYVDVGPEHVELSFDVEYNRGWTEGEFESTELYALGNNDDFYKFMLMDTSNFLAYSSANFYRGVQISWAHRSLAKMKIELEGAYARTGAIYPHQEQFSSFLRLWGTSQQLIFDDPSREKEAILGSVLTEFYKLYKLQKKSFLSQVLS
jgi:hypothetical protein